MNMTWSPVCSCFQGEGEVQVLCVQRVFGGSPEERSVAGGSVLQQDGALLNAFEAAPSPSEQCCQLSDLISFLKSDFCWCY